MDKYTPSQVNQYMDYVKKSYGDKYTPEQMKQYEGYVRTNFGDQNAASGNDKTFLDSATQFAKEEGPKALDATLKGLDYDRAVTGGPLIAKALGVYDPKEAEAARNFKAPYPSTSELLKRKGILADSPWWRGGVGLIGDIASSPTTYASGGLSALAKMARGSETLSNLAKAVKGADIAVNPIQALERSRAGNLYKKAFMEPDQLARQEGKALMPSEILKNENYSGSMEGAVNALENVNQRAGEAIGGTLKQAAEGGAQVDLMKEFEPAMLKAQSYRNIGSPEGKTLAKDIEDRIMEAWQTHGEVLPVDKANQLKSFINQRIKDAGFNQGAEAGLGTLARKTISSDLATGIPAAVEKNSPELAGKLAENNALYSSTAPVIRDKVQAIGNRMSERRPMVDLTKLDLSLLGGGVALLPHSPTAASAALGSLALKKLGSAAMSTEGRTLRGRLANTLGENSYGLVDTAVRKSPWRMLMEENKK